MHRFWRTLAGIALQLLARKSSWSKAENEKNGLVKERGSTR
jgi:hypothetical protein